MNNWSYTLNNSLYKLISLFNFPKPMMDAKNFKQKNYFQQ